MSRTGLPADAGRGVEWILRVGVFACFVGHGVFGLLAKPAWLAYFAALGIGPGLASWLMPVIGTVDIAVGCTALLRPGRAVLAWATFWGLATALLRPLAGEPFWEVLERAGNYGVPLALLVLLVGGASRLPRVGTVLQLSTALLLLGHGALALTAKPLLVGHALAVGVPPGAVPLLGGVEVGLALAVAAVPSAPLLLGVLGWKLATELLFPLSGAPIWEFVERGGSYAAPLALALLVARGRLAAAPLWRIPAAAAGRASLAASLAPAIVAGPVALLGSGLVAALGAAAGATFALGLALGAPAPLAAQQSRGAARWAEVTREVPAGEALAALVDDLREGGLTLLCRHAITDHDASDRGPAREQQRNLDAAGREQSARMGRALAEAAVPIGDVRASPMFRTMDTAELAFGRVEAEPRLRGSDARDGLVDLLGEVPRGGNRVLVSHQGTIRGAVPIGRSPLEEGDCLVIRPLGAGEGFEVLGRVGADDWAEAPDLSPSLPSPPAGSARRTG